MPLKKDLLFLAISYLSSRNAAPTPSQLDLVEVIRKEMRHEVAKMAIRIIVGLGIMSLLSWSVIQVARAIQTLLAQDPNAPFYEMGIFTTLSLACAGGLFALFKNSRSRSLAVHETPPLQQQSTTPFQDLERLIATFVKGFHEGMSKPSASPNSSPTNPTTDEASSGIA